ncbi:MAG TPA: hypothetical protein VE196_05930 [Pseudonocardiaceae bacterium]|nr:hypothetical protein [Pseudonocardiaceae bacterium]
MPAAAVFSIILAAITVLVLAAYLISIARILARIYAKLREVNTGLPVVTQRTKPIGSIVGEINSDLSGANDALRAVPARK